MEAEAGASGVLAQGEEVAGEDEEERTQGQVTAAIIGMFKGQVEAEDCQGTL